MKKGFLSILTAAGIAASSTGAAPNNSADVKTDDKTTAGAVAEKPKRKVYTATLEDIENIEKRDEFSSHLMGLMYDYHRYSKNQDDLSKLMAREIDQRKLKNRSILYTITSDRSSKELKLLGVDWNSALLQSCQKNVALWEDMAKRKGLSVEDYLAEELAKKIHISASCVNGSILSLLSDECGKAASKKHSELYPLPNLRSFAKPDASR